MTNVTTENKAINDHHNHDPHYILPPYAVPSIDHGPAGGHIPAEFQRSRLNSEKFQSKFMRWTIRSMDNSPMVARNILEHLQNSVHIIILICGAISLYGVKITR